MLLQNINSVPFMSFKYQLQEGRDIWGRQNSISESMESICGKFPDCQRKEVRFLKSSMICPSTNQRLRLGCEHHWCVSSSFHLNLSSGEMHSRMEHQGCTTR